MTAQLLQQLMVEIKSIKTDMVIKADLESMATKEDIKRIDKKLDEHSRMMNHNNELITRNFKQIAHNSELIDRNYDQIKQNSDKADRNFSQAGHNAEKLNNLSDSFKQQERIIETLSLRSIEQEGKLRTIKQV